MLALKRLIFALFIMFFIAPPAWALICDNHDCHNCYVLRQDGTDSCKTCLASYFCPYSGDDLEPAGTSGSAGLISCENVITKGTSNIGASSQTACYSTLYQGSQRKVTEESYPAVYGGKYYRVELCPSGYTSTCEPDSVINYGMTCECIAPEETINLTWTDGFNDTLPTDALENAVNNVYPSMTVINRALTLPAIAPYVTQDGLFNGWNYSGTVYTDEIPAEKLSVAGNSSISASWADDAMAVDFSNSAATGTLPSLSADIEYPATKSNKVRLMLKAGDCAPVYFNADEITSPDYPNGIFVGWRVAGLSTNRSYANALLYFFDGTPASYCGGSVSYVAGTIINVSPDFYIPAFYIRYESGATDAIGVMTDENCSINDESCVLADNAFERTGYTFSGWSAVLNRRVLPLYAGENDTISGSGTNKFVLRTQNLGVLDARADVVEYTKQITEIPFATSTGGSMLTLTAQWTPNKYTITFDLNNGEGSIEESVEYDSMWPASIPAPVRSGAIFMGYYDANGVQYYDENGNSLVGAYEFTQDIILTAKYTCVGGYYDNGTTCTICPDGSYCAEGSTEPTACPANSTSVAGSVSCTCDTGYNADGSTTTTGAACKANAYTATFNCDTSESEFVDISVAYGNEFTVPLPDICNNPGYTFKGWYADGTLYVATQSYTWNLLTDKTFTAQWEQATIACQPGKYYDGANFITCPAGVYCPYDANTSVPVGTPGCFVDCPIGYDDATNITSKFECAMNIEPGYYILNAYDSESTICPKGYSCPGNTMIRYGNKGNIYSCSGASYSDTQGSASCASCPSATNVFNANSVGNAPNDYDEYNDDMTDCYALYHFVEKWYTDAFYGGGDSAYNPDLELNQRGDFAVKCRYNKNTQSYESDCYGLYVNYCAAGYYSPKSQDASTYEDARNKIYENVDLSNPDTWPCQPVGEDYGFVSADINGQYINNLTDEEKLATLQRQCLPITNDAGAATYSVNTSSELFELSAPTCIVNYGFMPMYAFTETYKPGPNLRGYYLVSCLYNKDTKNYEGNCKAMVSYCESGYYTTMTPYTGDEYTDDMIYHSNNVQDAVAAVCIPVGYGYYSPGQMQCMLEQGINPEEVTYGNVPEIDTNALDMCLAKFVDINDTVAIQKAFSSRTQCPDGGLTDTDTAGDIVECYLESIDCVNADGNAGVKRCYYNKETKTYDANCGECQITSCIAGQYMTAQGCAPCPANSTSVAGSVSCTCDTGYNADGNTTTTGALCEPNAYTVTYISGDSLNITRTETATYNTEYTISNVAFEKTGYVQTGWKNVDLHQSIYTLGQKIIYNFDYNITLSPIYTCAAGYYGDGITCTICPVGSYCPVGATEPTICPENSTSEAGDTECVCKAGYSIDGDTTTDAACEPNVYTVTYRVGQVHPSYKVTFGTEHTTNPNPYPQTGRTQTGWSVMMPTYLSNKVFGLGETFTYDIPSNMDLGPKYRQNQFKLNFQDGGAYNAGDYTLPTDIVAEYDRALPDISGFGTIELRLFEPETTAGQRHLVSDGWSFDNEHKAWNKDGTDAGNYPKWNASYNLPIEDGTTVNVYPLWKTSALRCNAGYYIPGGDIDSQSCSACAPGSACPGFDEPVSVSYQYGMFACPDNSTSASTQGYCTCNEGFNTTGRPGGEDKIYPTIRDGFNGKVCQQIQLNVYYDLNGGDGDVVPGSISAYAEYDPRPLDRIGTVYGAPVYRAGYIFMGWGETPDATEPVTTIYAQEEDITVYAIWKPCDKGTYMVGQATSHHKAECDACPETHTNTVEVASTDINQCYAECDAQIDVVGGIAFSDNDKAYYDNVCTYSRGIDQEGNSCSVINGVCVQTDCAPDYEMVNGACVPCARKNALTYSDNGNCRIETCVYGFHPNGDQCEKNVIECIVPNAVSAERVWNDVSGSYSLCTVTQCTDGFHIDANACISNVRTCKIENGIGDQVWDEKRNRWGDCVATKCEPGYTNDPSLTNENWKLCGRCNNMFGVNGERAASSYVAECEIASCMHQGEKYILENNECRLVCDSYADETGRRYWGNGRCIHDCNSGYLPW